VGTQLAVPILLRMAYFTDSMTEGTLPVTPQTLINKRILIRDSYWELSEIVRSKGFIY
jgi:hypothetical protein